MFHRVQISPHYTAIQDTKQPAKQTNDNDCVTSVEKSPPHTRQLTLKYTIHYKQNRNDRTTPSLLKQSTKSNDSKRLYCSTCLQQ